MPKFPPTIYVSWKHDDSAGGSDWLSASKEAAEEVEDDGPTKIGTYRLVEMHIVSKSLTAKKCK